MSRRANYIVRVATCGSGTRGWHYRVEAAAAHEGLARFCTSGFGRATDYIYIYKIYTIRYGSRNLRHVFEILDFFNTVLQRGASYSSDNRTTHITRRTTEKVCVVKIAVIKLFQEINKDNVDSNHIVECILQISLIARIFHGYTYMSLNFDKILNSTAIMSEILRSNNKVGQKIITKIVDKALFASTLQSGRSAWQDGFGETKSSGDGQGPLGQLPRRGIKLRERRTGVLSMCVFSYAIVKRSLRVIDLFHIPSRGLTAIMSKKFVLQFH
uniref:Uncharacterized protein n=1 Tax=Trichogramma kaykai TaxID=54128 RepID=A0ABD2WQ30_9HYME